MNTDGTGYNFKTTFKFLMKIHYRAFFCILGLICFKRLTYLLDKNVVHEFPVLRFIEMKLFS